MSSKSTDEYKIITDKEIERWEHESLTSAFYLLKEILRGELDLKKAREGVLFYRKGINK